MSKSKENIRPFMRIYTKHRRITINLAAHDVLGRPPYFEFYWNDAKKLLFISSLWNAKKGCYHIASHIYLSRRSEIVLYEEAFFSTLMEKLCWKKDINYKVFGDFIPKFNMVGFQMANPIIMGAVNDENISPNN